jgi:hypothetical protein
VAAQMLTRQAQGGPLDLEQSNIADFALERVTKKIPHKRLPKRDTIVKKIKMILEVMNDLG